MSTRESEPATLRFSEGDAEWNREQIDRILQALTERFGERVCSCFASVRKGSVQLPVFIVPSSGDSDDPSYDLGIREIPADVDVHLFDLIESFQEDMDQLSNRER